MTPTPNTYSSNDDKVTVLGGGRAVPGRQSILGQIAFALFAILKAVIAIYVGFATLSALTATTLDSGYPAWIFIYSFFLIVLGIAYLGALAVTVMNKRLGLILMAVFVVAELISTCLLVIGAQGTPSLLGIADDVILLSYAIRFLRNTPQQPAAA